MQPSRIQLQSGFGLERSKRLAVADRAMSLTVPVVTEEGKREAGNGVLPRCQGHNFNTLLRLNGPSTCVVVQFGERCPGADVVGQFHHSGAGRHKFDRDNDVCANE